VDAIVPVTGTRAWIASMKRAEKESWTPYTVQGQVGGYYTVYDAFTFATVRNAGHMVPQWQPERALCKFIPIASGINV
jgi:carboxypeptidase C (cathepsin A)